MVGLLRAATQEDVMFAHDRFGKYVMKGFASDLRRSLTVDAAARGGATVRILCNADSGLEDEDALTIG